MGRYVVLSELGSSGMGVVYAAYDPELDRKVALELLRPELAMVVAVVRYPDRPPGGTLASRGERVPFPAVRGASWGMRGVFLRRAGIAGEGSDGAS